MKLVDSLNVREWNPIRRISLLIKLKKKENGFLEKYIFGTNLVRKIAQTLGKKAKNY